MCRYEVCTNYNKIHENNQHKGYFVYIDKMTKDSGNVVVFISSSHNGSTNKLPSCMFEEHEGNRVMVHAIKSVVAGKVLLINYNLNKINE